MSESAYQRKLIKQYESEGWTVLRLRDAPTSVAQTGTPDLLVIRPWDTKGVAEVKFIEVKNTGGKVSKLQEVHMRLLTERGFECEVNYKQ